MPFGKKKAKSSSAGGYPKQAPAYPTQKAAPPQQPYPGPPQQPYAGPPLQPYAGPPHQPSFLSSTMDPDRDRWLEDHNINPLNAQPYPGPPQQPYPGPPQQHAYPGPPGPQQPPAPVGPPPAYMPPAKPQSTAQPPPPAMVQGSFDQGARFNPGKPVHIPPPPPGVAPTTAQVCAGQGQSVVMTQDKKDLWGGGSDGGMTIW